MSSQMVEIDLDRPRSFRFTIFDARDACRYLSNIPGKGHVDSLRLLILLASRDWDAWSAVLAEGLKHEEPNLRPDRALRYLTDFAQNGGNMAELARKIRQAGEQGGVWEPMEEGNEETDRGNARGTASGASRPST